MNLLSLRISCSSFFFSSPYHFQSAKWAVDNITALPAPLQFCAKKTRKKQKKHTNSTRVAKGCVRIAFLTLRRPAARCGLGRRTNASLTNRQDNNEEVPTRLRQRRCKLPNCQKKTPFSKSLPKKRGKKREKKKERSSYSTIFPTPFSSKLRIFNLVFPQKSSFFGQDASTLPYQVG